jgi:hypothetical protein
MENSIHALATKGDVAIVKADLLMVKNDLATVKFELAKDISEAKAETIKWMFIF